ncbi:MAG: GAF domain-containing protein [Anaerolineae bacterium]|nr:GAF domain-containing protein [Anaerolineae bacterium]
MPLVLLISPDYNLSESLALPELKTINLAQVSTVNEVQVYLASCPPDAPPVNLILLQSESDPPLVAACRRLRQYPWAKSIPLIALLHQPEERLAVLEAGADDYLLLPLLPTEVKTRLNFYLRSPLPIFAGLSPVIDQLKRGTVSRAVWEQGLKQLAQQYQAESAWVFLLDQAESKTTLAAGHNRSPFPIQEGKSLNREIKALIQCEPLPGGGPHWLEVEQAPTGYHFILLLKSHHHLFGLLVLSYPSRPLLSQFDKDTLAALSQNLGTMLEMQQIQQDTQVYATHNAFMLLLARTISQQLDLDAILSLTLEQVIPLLNAASGEIWLLGPDEAWLELASSLTASSTRRQLSRRPSAKGLLGWVAQHGQALSAALPARDPRFDPAVDLREDGSDYSLLAAPLRHRDQTIGVLAVYGQANLTYTPQDVVLLESIAGLAASALANARLLGRIREYSEQSQTLYEMSRQIAAGLDLESTLQRILYWVDRLFGIEAALLWLIKESGEVLRLTGASRVDLPDEPLIELPLGQGLAGWVAQSGEAVIVNDPVRDPRPHWTTAELLRLPLRNLMAAPMMYHGQTIGVLCLVNKDEGLFTEADLTLLSTALEMIASAVGNARLHTQTVALMEERERLSQQLLQNERLAIIGRLTGALSHEINNPMQAIQGALVLALEELDSPADLAAYLQLCLQESKRVIQLLERLSRIYRPRPSESPEWLDLNALLGEVIQLAHNELKRQKVTLQTHLAPHLPQVRGVPHQLHLVFLSLLLNLSDAIGVAGGGKLQLRSEALPEMVCIEFSTDLAVLPIANWLAVFRAEPTLKEGELSFGLSLSRDIIAAHRGLIELMEQDQQTVCTIKLPFKV